MILLASSHATLTTQWREVLITAGFELYEVDAKDLRGLELLLKKVSIDVCLVDLELLGESGVNEISSLKDIQSNIHIIIMTQNFEAREEISAILFGAKAYCSATESLDMLPKIVKTIMNNELWVDRKFVTRLLAEIEDIASQKHAEAQQLHQGISAMTPRENEIAGLVAIGCSNRKIAERLSISERTVKAHLGVIFRKMGINDRLQLALFINRHQQLSSIWHGSKPTFLDDTNKEKE